MLSHLLEHPKVYLNDTKNISQVNKHFPYCKIKYNSSVSCNKGDFAHKLELQEYLWTLPIARLTSRPGDKAGNLVEKVDFCYTNLKGKIIRHVYSLSEQ